jgi:hypothetical protein
MDYWAEYNRGQNDAALQRPPATHSTNPTGYAVGYESVLNERK